MPADHTTGNASGEPPKPRQATTQATIAHKAGHDHAAASIKNRRQKPAPVRLGPLPVATLSVQPKGNEDKKTSARRQEDQRQARRTDGKGAGDLRSPQHLPSLPKQIPRCAAQTINELTQYPHKHPPSNRSPHPWRAITHNRPQRRGLHPKPHLNIEAPGPPVCARAGPLLGHTPPPPPRTATGSSSSGKRRHSRHKGRAALRLCCSPSPHMRTAALSPRIVPPPIPPGNRLRTPEPAHCCPKALHCASVPPRVRPCALVTSQTHGRQRKGMHAMRLCVSADAICAKQYNGSHKCSVQGPPRSLEAPNGASPHPSAWRPSMNNKTSTHARQTHRKVCLAPLFLSYP